MCNMEKVFVPVRILDKKWALKFISGEIFMRSLADFGSWNRFDNIGNEKIVNNYRGDLCEGAFKTIAKPEDDGFLKHLPDSMQEHFISGKLIDYGEIMYFNVLCMYCQHYYPLANKFETPSKRLKEFGDTAVVITDMNAFFDRLFEQIEWKKKYTAMVNVVEYYGEKETKELNPLFNKTKFYSWQNELRIAVGKLDIHHKLKNGKYPLIRSDAPLKLRIGRLDDITRLVPIADFISGNWDKSGIKLSQSSFFLKNAIATTKAIMSEYTPGTYKPMFTIG